MKNSVGYESKKIKFDRERPLPERRARHGPLPRGHPYIPKRDGPESERREMCCPRFFRIQKYLKPKKFSNITPNFPLKLNGFFNEYSC